MICTSRIKKSPSFSNGLTAKVDEEHFSNLSLSSEIIKTCLLCNNINQVVINNMLKVNICHPLKMSKMMSLAKWKETKYDHI